MKEIIKLNNSYLNNSEILFYNSNTIKEIKSSLEKEKLITITWLRTINKTAYINISLNNFKNKLFYFNKKLDLINKIKSDKDLIELVKEYTIIFSKPDFIVLEDINKIKNIKDFIAKFYKAWYKIIIIDNSISIPSKPEIEIYNPNYSELQSKLWDNYNINSYILFWDNEKIALLKNKNLKISFLESLKNEIILKDLVEAYSLKNIFLLKQTITFLSLLNTPTTLRELHRNINEQIKISL